MVLRPLLTIVGVWAIATAAATAQPAQKQLQPTKSGEDPRALKLDDIQKRVPPGVKFIPDISYREGDKAYWKLDLAMPEKSGDKPRPALVIVHGGGWSTGDKRLGWCVQPLLDYAATGYVCISINYRLTSEGGFPANIEDCKCAVRWLRAHAKEYKVDPNRIGAFGSSAGAHLAAMLGLADRETGLEGDGPYQDQSSQVNAVCAVATPTDFSDWGRGRFANEGMAKKCSPVTYARANSPPILLIHGTEDKTVPMTQPQRLVDALSKAGAKDVKLIKLEGAGHGAVMSRSKEIGPMMAEFLDRTIGPKATAKEPQDTKQKEDGQGPLSTTWVYPDKREPAGTKYKTFHSKTIKGEVSYLIYLPPDYDKSPDKRYPVVYWLPGGPGRQTILTPMVARLDPAIRAGNAPPMIVVGVNGIRHSFYCDSADGKWPVETVIIKDLIPHIDATYRTIAKRESRALEGFSMGGWGVFHLGLKHPDQFGVLSDLAGALLTVESMSGRHADIYQRLFDAKKEKFEAESPWTLVRKNADAIRGKTRIRIVVGDKDQTYKMNGAYHELLENLKVPHEYIVLPGVAHNHGTIYQALGDRSWEFWSKAFGKGSP